MSESTPLFEIVSELAFKVGDAVRVQTIYGSEAGVVTHVGGSDYYGFPLVTVDLKNGDRISISIARLRRIRETKESS